MYVCMYVCVCECVCSLHTRKTNNTNKLTQVSYHSVLTKIIKLKKIKIKKLFCTGQYGRYLNQYETLTFRYRYVYWYNINHLAKKCSGTYE